MATRLIPLVLQFLLLEVISSSIPSVSSVQSSSFLWTASHLWPLPVLSTSSPQESPPRRPFWQFFHPNSATCLDLLSLTLPIVEYFAFTFTFPLCLPCTSPTGIITVSGASSKQAARAPASLTELHQGSLLRGEVVVEVELAGHEHDPLHHHLLLLVHLPVSLQPLSKELSTVATEEVGAKQPRICRKCCLGEFRGRAEDFDYSAN